MKYHRASEALPIVTKKVSDLRYVKLVPVSHRSETLSARPRDNQEARKQPREERLVRQHNILHTTYCSMFCGTEPINQYLTG